MVTSNDLKSISDDDLLRRLADLSRESRRVESDLVAHIAEVDGRRLYAREACSSMFVYCREVLHLAEHEAYLRIAAARAARRYPIVLVMLRDSRLHLSGIAKLAKHLTDANHEEVLARAVHKSKREIEELAAEPKPDVPASVRKLPEHADPAPRNVLGPDRVTFLPNPEPVKEVALPATAPSPPSRPVVQPLSPARYKVTFTASSELRDKLERLQALTQEDLAAAIEAAVTEKIERLEAKRYAKTTRPRKNLHETDTSPKSRYIPAAVRRAVFKRDGARCGFVDKMGRRCSEQRNLEFHHHDPFSRGGAHDSEQISLRCRTHNIYLAERDYGKDTLERYRRRDDRVSESAPLLGAAQAAWDNVTSGAVCDFARSVGSRQRVRYNAVRDLHRS